MYNIHLPTESRKVNIHMLVVCAVLLLSGSSGCETKSYRRAAEPVIKVCFSPRGGCTEFVNEAIAKAQNTLLVQAYFFTSLPIANALLKAHQQGITVHILVDRSQLTFPYTQIYYMSQKGISVLIDKTSGIAHNKVMIIDDNYVLTGSFNWTKAAENHNAENLLLIKSKKINHAYKEVWYQRAQQAQKLVPN